MRKFIPVLVMALMIPPMISAEVNAGEIDSTHIACIQTGQDILGVLNLECNISTEQFESDPDYQVQYSSNGKSWKNVKDKDPFIFRNSGECSGNDDLSVQPLVEPIEPECLVLRLMYEPSKVGNFFLRLAVVLNNQEYLSNSVAYEASDELLAEQVESRAIDARNRSYSLLVKWPYKIPVGTPYGLSISSKEKYSGVCTLRAVTGSPVSFQNFKIKNGKAKVPLRGLKVGNSHVNISCRQSSGSGPYASSYADVYFSR